MGGSLREGTWDAVEECVVEHEDCRVGRRREKDRGGECMRVNRIKEQKKEEKIQQAATVVTFDSNRS